jgi:hypothetical protein
MKQFGEVLLATLRDVLPIVLVIVLFQVGVLRRRVPRLGPVVVGFGLVILGLTLFLVGLEKALFPLGESMAAQLAKLPQVPGDWREHGLTYLFGFSVGLAAAIAEPALLAVAQKAEEVSGGTIASGGLRWAVAVGVGVGVALGVFRIVVGWPLPYFILGGYMLVLVQTALTPKWIVPLAYDSGGVATSTVTVPLVAALGMGLASRVPGRDPLVDGFGLIAFAALLPVITVMAYAQVAQILARRRAEV